MPRPHPPALPFSVGVAAISGCLMAACGSVTLQSTDSGAGTGGAGGPGSGGATATGGTSGTGGATGTGGSTGTGGMNGRVPQRHRPAAVDCLKDRSPGACNMPDAGVPIGGISCRTDADCTAGQNGRCNTGGHIAGCVCTYDACFSDTDCGQTKGPCECRDTLAALGLPPSTSNVCLPGDCRTDKDCGGGSGYCSPSLGTCGAYGGVVGYFCHTPKDQCIDDGDCAAQGGGDCRYNMTSGIWDCEKSACAG